MEPSSRETSPDPLTLPSSPLAKHLPRRRRRKSLSKPLVSQSTNPNVSPSKTFVMDTDQTGDASPWRIKVTVEAEPKDGMSGSARRPNSTRTMKVPLNGGESSSPTKQLTRRTPGADKGAQAKRPARKRKGTPMNRPTPSRLLAPTAEEDEEGDEGSISALPPSSPSQHLLQSTSLKRRQTLNPMPSQRSKRLSHAREELDLALQEAVGTSQPSAYPPPLSSRQGFLHSDLPGDMTVGMNEDFTMVSVESLQTYKDLANGSHVNIPAGEAEGTRASVSYLPSSPPPDGLVSYPDLTAQAVEARSVPVARNYDEMSWKPTVNAQIRSPSLKEHQTLNSGPIEWQEQRQAVSRRIEQANPSQVIVIDDDTAGSAYGDYVDDANVSETERAEVSGDHMDIEADIWQEEASRTLDSVEEEQPSSSQHLQQHALPSGLFNQPTAHPPSTEEKIQGLFDEPVKPRRVKIPRTWRRTSGNDFAYSDSPAHEHSHREEGLKPSGNSTDAESRGSGVLTPPSSGDEAGKVPQQSEPSELTEPDAAATQLQGTSKNKIVGLALDSAMKPGAADVENFEVSSFFQHNTPAVRQSPLQRSRPQRKRAMDLSELLNLQSSPAKIPPHSVKSGESTSRETYQKKAAMPDSPNPRPATSMVGKPPSEDIGGKMGDHASKFQASRGQEARDSSVLNITEESFASKASDQRQLLAETGMAGQAPAKMKSTFRTSQSVHAAMSDVQECSQELSLRKLDYEDGDSMESLRTSEDLYDTSQLTEGQMRSYEENLNLESPQKIGVKFNDSMGNSSLLVPTTTYPSLFGTGQRTTNQPPVQPTGSQPPTNKSAPTKTLPQPRGIISRISNTIWSALVRPTGATEIVPARDPEYSPSLRTKLRNRYGVVARTHPWTMVHMRTLHRMLNSRMTQNHDTIIPSAGPLPKVLLDIAGTRQTSVTGDEFVFTYQHAHIVQALMQVLVPSTLTEAIKAGEVEFLGDRMARHHRGLDEAGREGEDLVWAGYDFGLPEDGKEIDVMFVLRALGDCVGANVAKEQRIREEKARAEALEADMDSELESLDSEDSGEVQE